MPKPALGPVKVGDRLLVIRPSSRYRDNDPIPARAVKVARIWIDLETEGGHAWRLRLDTQNEGSQHSQQNRFVTPEQYAWEQRQSAISAYLREQRVTVEPSSPWCDEDRLLALANFLRQHDGLDPL